MTKLSAAAAACAVFLAGCATAPPAPIAVVESAAFGGQGLQTISHKRPDFLPMRPSNAAFGAIGALAMISEGRSYPETHHLVDPSPQIEQRLADDLHARFGGDVRPEPLDMTNAAAGTLYPPTPGVVLVDAQSTGWGFSYFPANWGRFRVSYSMRLLLVDGATDRVLSSAVCSKVSHTSPDDAPTLDDLVADDSALLNRLVSDMANACLTEFEAAALPVSASAPTGSR